MFGFEIFYLLVIDLDVVLSKIEGQKKKTTGSIVLRVSCVSFYMSQLMRISLIYIITRVCNFIFKIFNIYNSIIIKYKYYFLKVHIKYFIIKKIMLKNFNRVIRVRLFSFNKLNNDLIY